MTSTAPTSVFRISGYAALFGRRDLSGDIIRPGAFTTRKRGQKLVPGHAARVMMLYQHAADRPVGLWRGMREDDHGLFVEGDILLTTSAGRDLAALIAGGAIDGLSIGFRPGRARRLKSGERELLSVDLWEISIVSFPMAPGARIIRAGIHPSHNAQ